MQCAWLLGKGHEGTSWTARPLAGVLRVSAKEITVASEPVLVATAYDQLAAAELLRGASLLDRLGPVGQWETLEKLLKSAVVSGLSDEARGDFLNSLSIALWRQDKIVAAAE